MEKFIVRGIRTFFLVNFFVLLIAECVNKTKSFEVIAVMLFSLFALGVIQSLINIHKAITKDRKIR